MEFTEMVYVLLTFTVFLNCFVMYALRGRWLKASEECDDAWRQYRIEERGHKLSCEELSKAEEKLDRIRKYQQTIRKLQTELTKLDNELGGFKSVATWTTVSTAGDPTAQWIRVDQNMEEHNDNRPHGADSDES